MSAVLPIVLAILLVVAFGFILRALVWAMRQDNEEVYDDSEIRALRIEKSRAVESLRDLEFDLQLKKISQEDYDAMRGPAQRRAIEAIRALDEAGRKLGSFVLICVMCIISPADAESFEGSTSKKNGLIETTRVMVREMGEDGVFRPASGVRVLLEAKVRRLGRGNPEEIGERGVAATDANGVATHVWNIPAGSEILVRVERDGHIFHGEKGDVFHFVSIHPVDVNPAAFRLEPRAILSIREGVVWVQGEWMVEHQEVVAVSTGEAGIILPLIAPILNGESLQAQWMPVQAKRHMKLAVDGESADAHIRGGNLVFHGVIHPGETARIKFEYPIDIYHNSLQLGIQSEQIEVKRVMVAVNAPEKLLPGLRLTGAPVRGLQEDRRGEITHLQWTIGKLDLNQLITIRLSKLPHEGDLSRTIAGWIIVVVSCLFVLGLIRVFYVQREEKRKLGLALS